MEARETCSNASQHWKLHAAVLSWLADVRPHGLAQSSEKRNQNLSNVLKLSGQAILGNGAIHFSLSQPLRARLRSVDNSQTTLQNAVQV